MDRSQINSYISQIESALRNVRGGSEAAHPRNLEALTQVIRGMLDVIKAQNKELERQEWNQDVLWKKLDGHLRALKLGGMPPPKR